MILMVVVFLKQCLRFFSQCWQFDNNNVKFRIERDSQWSKLLRVSLEKSLVFWTLEVFNEEISFLVVTFDKIFKFLLWHGGCTLNHELHPVYERNIDKMYTYF